MTDSGFDDDDDVTVDVDEGLLAEVRAEAARRRGAGGSGSGSDEEAGDDDVTVDVDEGLLAEVRAEAARRRGAGGSGSGSDEGAGDDDVTVDVDEGLLAEVRAEAARRRGAGVSGSGSDEGAGDGVPGVGGVPVVDGYGEFREIGRGGFSRVFEAKQTGLNKWVAVKVLNEAFDRDEEVAEFERECRLMGELSHHPNIVTVLASVYSSDGRPCIVMELFPHGSYWNILRSTGPLGLRELLSLGVSVSGALATAHSQRTAHSQGMVHGDVKPQNIFRSEFGSAALGDFGIATLIGRGLSDSRTRLSLNYAAPELVERGVSAASPFADQYSLAATMFVLLTGRRPFETGAGDSTVELLTRALSEPAPRLGGEFPALLADVLQKAMAFEPRDRHRDMAAFAAAVVNIEESLGFSPTAVPITRDSGRYIGHTPESPVAPTDDPTVSRDQGERLAVQPGTAAEDQDADLRDKTIVRSPRPIDTNAVPLQSDEPPKVRRITSWVRRVARSVSRIPVRVGRVALSGRQLPPWAKLAVASVLLAAVAIGAWMFIARDDSSDQPEGPGTTVVPSNRGDNADNTASQNPPSEAPPADDPSTTPTTVADDMDEGGYMMDEFSGDPDPSGTNVVTTSIPDDGDDVDDVDVPPDVSPSLSIVTAAGGPNSIYAGWYVDGDVSSITGWQVRLVGESEPANSVRLEFDEALSAFGGWLYEWTGLTAGATYTVYVRVLTAGDSSDWESASATVPPPGGTSGSSGSGSSGSSGSPGSGSSGSGSSGSSGSGSSGSGSSGSPGSGGELVPPSTPIVTAVGRDKSIFVRWDATDNGSPITGWEVRDGDGSNPLPGDVRLKSKPVLPGDVRLTLWTELPAGATYTVEVRAINAGGNSPWGSSRKVTVLSGPAPEMLIGGEQANQIRVHYQFNPEDYACPPIQNRKADAINLGDGPDLPDPDLADGFFDLFGPIEWTDVPAGSYRVRLQVQDRCGWSELGSVVVTVTDLPE